MSETKDELLTKLATILSRCETKQAELKTLESQICAKEARKAQLEKHLFVVREEMEAVEAEANVLRGQLRDDSSGMGHVEIYLLLTHYRTVAELRATMIQEQTSLLNNISKSCLEMEEMHNQGTTLADEATEGYKSARKIREKLRADGSGARIEEAKA